MRLIAPDPRASRPGRVTLPTLDGMILLWLLPAVVVTVTAMLWVSWWGREGRGVVDREEGLERMARALDDDRPRRPWQRAPRPAYGYAVEPRESDRSTGVAVRASEQPRPARAPRPAARQDAPERRAS